MMSVRMKNHEIKEFIELLFGFTLKGKDSRMRTRFLKLLQERYQLMLDEIDSVQHEFAMTDENGDVVYTETTMPDGEKVKSFSVADPKKYNEEVASIMNEDFIIEMNEERRMMLESVRDSVLNCEEEFSGREAVIYDALCEVVEIIRYK